MSPNEYNDDFVKAGMTAWNTLTELLESDGRVFDDTSEFKDFYSVVMYKLLEEEGSL